MSEPLTMTGMGLAFTVAIGAIELAKGAMKLAAKRWGNGRENGVTPSREVLGAVMAHDTKMEKATTAQLLVLQEIRDDQKDATSAQQQAATHLAVMAALSQARGGGG